MRGSFRVVRRKSGRRRQRRGPEREGQRERLTRRIDCADGATGEPTQEGWVDRSAADL